MRTVQAEELELVIARRRALGQDGHDEIWDGEYWMAPQAHSRHGRLGARLSAALLPYADRAGLEPCEAFNLGDPDDFRIPDGGYFDQPSDALYVATAALVVEVLSPDDETFRKFDFYALRGVREVIVAFLDERVVRCYDLTRDAVEVPVSSVLGVDLSALSADLRWPAEG